jgi:hypothetical protein
MEQVQVSAFWDEEGWFSPRQFTWQGQTVRVESTGRQWEDEGGLHVLCMAFGGKAFELVFRLNPAGWWVRPLTTRPGMA